MGKTALEMNLDRRDTDSVVFSFDLDRHKTDRQKSRELLEPWLTKIPGQTILLFSFWSKDK